MTKQNEKDAKRVPELRFKGFADAWEQRKSKELFINISDKHHPELSVLSATQDNGMVYRRDLDIDIKYDEGSLDNYKKVSPSDFVISLRSFQGGFEMSDKLGITSPAYTIFNFKNPNNQYPVFWKFLFKRYDFIESLKRVTFGIRDGKAISFKQFGDTKPSFPQLKEQQ
ncbi:restriction endonuclease subunit S, partial [Limosilactobacillus mucosae]